MFNWIRNILNKKSPIISKRDKNIYKEKRAKAKKHIMDLVNKGIKGEEYIQAKKEYYKIDELYKKHLKL